MPAYDILVTNPPYSGDHKQRLLDYISSTSTPYALLLPAYTATKSYWKTFVETQDARFLTPPVESSGGKISTSISQASKSGGEAGSSVLYLLPPSSYQYDHPEGTGKYMHSTYCLIYCESWLLCRQRYPTLLLGLVRRRCLSITPQVSTPSVRHVYLLL